MARLMVMGQVCLGREGARQTTCEFSATLGDGLPEISGVRQHPLAGTNRQQAGSYKGRGWAERSKNQGAARAPTPALPQRGREQMQGALAHIWSMAVDTAAA